MDHPPRMTCRFCMKIINKDEFNVIGEITKKMLKILVLKLDLEADKESVMCYECAADLQSAIDFKTSCLNKNQKICRFCMRVTESGCYTHLQDTKENVFIIDMVQKHIPELHLSVTEEVVTCKNCLDSLQSFSSFITNCLETEENMKRAIVETVVKSEFEVKESPDSPLPYEVKYSNVDMYKVEKICSENVEDVSVKDEIECYDEMEIDDLDISIKNEDLNIKFDEDDYERFGIESPARIEEINKTTPINTVRSKKSVWSHFEKFCTERGYDVLSAPLRPEKINDILKDWGFNMKKYNGANYKELVVKQMWNSVAKQLQELYLKMFHIQIDPFLDVTFASSRGARDSHRKKLQLQPQFRRVSSVALSKSEMYEMITSHDEDTPDGLQKKFFHLAVHELAWGAGEAAYCLVDFFKEEYDSRGVFTGRIEYNPFMSEYAQGGSKKCTDSKWLITNTADQSVCPVRILQKLLSKRNNIAIERLFLRPNQNWEKCIPNSLWYKNSPVGKNTLYKWINSITEAMGVDAKKMKIPYRLES